MTASELLAHCKTFEAEHGALVLLDVLDAVSQDAAQEAGVDILDMEEADEGFQVVTLQ